MTRSIRAIVAIAAMPVGNAPPTPLSQQGSDLYPRSHLGPTGVTPSHHTHLSRSWPGGLQFELRDWRQRSTA
jgi:hypothetical protein